GRARTVPRGGRRVRRPRQPRPRSERDRLHPGGRGDAGAGPGLTGTHGASSDARLLRRIRRLHRSFRSAGRLGYVHVQGPVVPMLARSVDRIPEPGSRPDGWRYEPKWDGYRQIAIVDDFGSVRIYSRRGTRLEEAFPELVGDLYASVPRATVIDGEIVRWSPQGRLDFDALHYRYAHRRQGRELAESTPCHLVCFDVLEA